MITALNQWLGAIALIFTIANAAWTWLSRPARDTNKRIDEVDEKLETLIAEQDSRADRHREDLKGHDRRIQRVEDDMPHLPTKDDLNKLGNQLTAVKTELDIVARTLTRIDNHLMRQP